MSGGELPSWLSAEFAESVAAAKKRAGPMRAVAPRSSSPTIGIVAAPLAVPIAAAQSPQTASDDDGLSDLLALAGGVGLGGFTASGAEEDLTKGVGRETESPRVSSDGDGLSDLLALARRFGLRGFGGKEADQ
jgi:hypothetical protein